MAKIFGALAKLNIKGRLARAALNRYAIDIMKVGIRAWLNKAESIIPIWSGQSQGSLQAVADLIGEQISQFGSIAPGAPNRWHQGVSAGSANLEANKSSGTYKFTADVDIDGELFYLELNEKYNMNPKLRPLNDPSKPLHRPGPYNYREQCNQAFKDAVNGELRRFNLLSFLTKYVTIETKVIG